MSTQLDLLNTPAPAGRQAMNGKPVFTRPAKTVINFESNFSHKLLCDGPTFSAGDACVYSCAFCYVPDLVRKLRATAVMEGIVGKHEDIVIRRANAVAIARAQLQGRKDRFEKKVIYSSPMVDVAGNMELVQETIEICKVILELTRWDIRLLSKSNLLPKVAEGLGNRERLIFGVSTGTLDDGLAKAFEEKTPLVSKRIQSLHWLQDNGFRTYGMVCPSLPMNNPVDYRQFAFEAAAAIRAERCEHVWAEVINVRGESFTRTEQALGGAGFEKDAALLRHAMGDRQMWERYARLTFQAHSEVYKRSPGKLRFLQYVTPASKGWWESQAKRGAVVL
jgi:DNA repair photolyase